MPGWDPDFDTYLTVIDDVPASFLIDLAAARHAPLDSHPVRLQVRITLQAPREDGLRSEEEAPMVNALEDRIIDGLAERVGAVFVGHELSQGYVHVVAYAPRNRVGDEAELLDWLEDDGYEVAWLTEDDTAWGMYFEYLYPGPWELQAINNRRLLTQLAAHGDEPTAPRLVDHVALFRDQAAATRASEPLRGAGFEVDAPEQDDEVWVVQFRRTDALADGRADEFCAEVLSILDEYGGHYDGWGCPVVSSPR